MHDHRVFTRVLTVVFVASLVLGFFTFVWSGATTNRGTTGAISAESALIRDAERASCRASGSYATIATLRREGYLLVRPQYNSVVIIPGPHCGTVVVGSPSYQSSSG